MTTQRTAVEEVKPVAAPQLTSSGARRRRPSSLGWIILFLAPIVTAIVVLRIMPALVAMSQSLYRQIPGSVADAKFVGLDNYVRLLGDESFHQVVAVTLLFTVLINPIQVVLALALAVLMIRRVRGAGVLRILLFIPVTVPAVGSAIIWGIALRPQGPINGLLQLVGLPAQPFLTSPSQSMLSIIIVCSWIGVGFLMSFLIAGLQALPREVYEAAELDRSGPIRTFFQITLPLLRRQVLFVLVTATVANFVVFAPIQLLTRGGPQGSTNILMYDAYRQTFGIGNGNVGSAEVVILVAIMLVIVGVQFRLVRGDD
jgi:multiple sugar transport system permease protein